MKRPLVVGVQQIPSNFDMEQPAGFQNDLGSDVFQNLYDQLVQPCSFAGDDGVVQVDWHNLRADLAEAWWFSDDCLTCTFRLRRGVLSHDGRELTADDVKWGWDRAFALRDVGKWVARVSSVQEAENVEVVDRYTVAFHLTAPNPLLPRAMAQATPSVYDREAVLAGRDEGDPWAKALLGRNPAGFGPYRIAGRDDDELVLTAHPGYRRGPAAIPEVRLKRYESRDAAIEALASDEVNLVIGLSLDQANAVRSRSGVRVTGVNATAGLVLHLDVTEPPFDDVRVRQAVAFAVPYQEIIQTAYLGLARPWKSWLQPESPGYAGDAWPYSENLARAKDLMRESTASAGFKTRLAILPGDGVATAGEIIRESLARIGIDAVVETVQAEVRRLVGQDKANVAPLMLRSGGGRGHRVYDPAYALFHDYSPGRMRLTRYAYENPEFYEALKAIPLAGHGAPWEAASRRAQQILNADAAVIPICGNRWFVAHSVELSGYRWYPDNRLPFFDMHWR